MEKPKKYYTAFVLFSGVKLYHCTHKYFGELSDDELKRVTALCDDYFRGYIRSFPILNFCEEAFFGPDKNIRVLKEPYVSFDYFWDLREFFDGIRKDAYPECVPHVTATAGEYSISDRFHSYALMSGQDQVYRFWRNPAFYG